MSLDKMHNWNGEYRLLKEIEQVNFKISNSKYIESFYILVDCNSEDSECFSVCSYPNKLIKYTIIDELFGMPSLANTENTNHAIKLRQKSIKILDKLESEGFIEKII